MSPKEEYRIDITQEVFKEPIEVIKKLTANIDIEYTKVIQTYVMENRVLELILLKDGSSYFKGKIVWIGNRKDDSNGTVFCIDTKTELKTINPTAENTDNIILDRKKEAIMISTESKAKCSVCGKNIEIFDDVMGCPLCGAKAHKDHLLDWIKMKHNCPVCKKSLDISSTGQIIVD